MCGPALVISSCDRKLPALERTALPRAVKAEASTQHTATMAVANAGRGGSDLDLQDEEELLLIISGMGEHLQAEKRYMIGAECKDCISDLQRYLRRDDPMSLAAHRALGSWRVLQTHLVPLLQATGDSDTKLAFNCLKVIVKLTMKPEQLAMRIYDHLKEKKDPDPAYGARLTELKRYHRAYKRAFIKADAMGSVVWLLGRALSVPEDVRSDDEEMMIELLLTLVLNLLHTTHPDETPPDPGDASNHIADRETLRALLSAMDGEHVLETLLYVLQQVEESPTYRNFNLNLLEISYYVLSAHTPGELFAKDEEASALTKENIKAAEKKVEEEEGRAHRPRAPPRRRRRRRWMSMRRRRRRRRRKRAARSPRGRRRSRAPARAPALCTMAANAAR